MTARVPFAERGGPVRGLVDLATGCYPAFLFGGGVGRMIPVFHFHDVTPSWLEPRLRYLAENGYRTASCDEIARVVLDHADPGPRTVGLTFDDAWASVWTVAAPLLKQYGLTATVFAIPSRVPDAEAVRPTIRTTSWERVQPLGPAFATWPELKALQSGGVIDVQSHTRSHAMIFCDPRVTGFVTPEYGRRPVLERPLVSPNGDPHFLEPDALGAPIYLRRSRMTDARRWLPDPSVEARCRAHVEKGGGVEFFWKPGWEAELKAMAAGAPGRMETDEERAAAIRAELADARATLNDRLGTTTVRHVALPWGLAGDVTCRALAETGHVTAYAEQPLRRRGVRPGDDRFHLMRLNSTLLTCLPGRGRQWFLTAVR
jgi:peptidoglycan/xylan/chitin deacetylase (PgdA/CDA1 family)